MRIGRYVSVGFSATKTTDSEAKRRAWVDIRKDDYAMPPSPSENDEIHLYYRGVILNLYDY